MDQIKSLISCRFDTAGAVLGSARSNKYKQYIYIQNYM